MRPVDRLTQQGIAIKKLAVYIPDSMIQDEGVDEPMKRWKINRTPAASRKIEHEPRISEVVWSIVILVAHTCEIWGKPVLLRVGSRTL